MHDYICCVYVFFLLCNLGSNKWYQSMLGEPAWRFEEATWSVDQAAYVRCCVGVVVSNLCGGCFVNLRGGSVRVVIAGGALIRQRACM